MRDDDAEATRSERLLIGIDLAWSSGTTGLAAVDSRGALVSLSSVKTDEEIDSWLEEQERPLVVAVDAPLVVPNETGQRRAEKEISRTFGAFGASAHTSNRQRSAGGDSRARQLARRRGWLVDPASSVGAEAVCVEVYPHPALVGLFELPYRLDYKKGSAERRRPGLQALVSLVESVPELRAREHPRWRHITATISSTSRGLGAVEDEVDAVVCAHLAWLWVHHRDRLMVYGDVHDGYIVAARPPVHAPARPLTETAPAPPRRATVERFVRGRPTGYGGSRHEALWRQAVAEAFDGEHLLGPDRVEVVLDVVLGPAQVGRSEPDLDNVLKTTIDALGSVLGRRDGTGDRVEADDVRVSRIVASKRPAREGEVPGARIALTLLPSSGQRGS
ncbi:DUF429 domain-containing protein [Pseudokineococcus basanitobsidens]|uniref:DUF429 domain-containing protein n=1 Tax=Pseudokineococcus basanitobsidens TaxID=1926649 RepID=A0ABU8RIU8_9ACTN